MSKTNDKIHYEETTCGFEYGSLKITRIHSDKKKKWVVIEARTPKANIQIYVTKTGLMTIHPKGKVKINPGENIKDE